jgi:hypothetical protein
VFGKLAVPHILLFFQCLCLYVPTPCTILGYQAQTVVADAGASKACVWQACRAPHSSILSVLVPLYVPTTCTILGYQAQTVVAARGQVKLVFDSLAVSHIHRLGSCCDRAGLGHPTKRCTCVCERAGLCDRACECTVSRSSGAWLLCVS